MMVEKAKEGPKPKPTPTVTAVPVDEVLVKYPKWYMQCELLGVLSMTSQQQYEVDSQSEHLSDELLA